MNVRSTYSAHRRLVVGAIVLAVAAGGVTGLATSALFTDSANVDAGAFTTGTVSLTAGPATVLVPLPAVMAPGNKVTSPITVTNDGSLPMRYSMTSVTTGNTAMAAAMQMTIKTGVTTCDNAGFAGTGAPLVGPLALGSAAGTPIIGTIAAGGGNGEQTVVNGTPQILCVQVVLPTSYAAENTTADATFTFNGEQTTNN